MIRCITFDLDDTLWAVDPVIQQANETLFTWLEQHAPEFTRCYQLRDLVELRRTVLNKLPHIAHSVSLIRYHQLHHGLIHAGYDSADAELLAERAFEVFLQARQQVVFFEHAREVLLQLKEQGYRLGALSNGNADIHRVGLSDVMDFQFSADQVGEMKPHPLMFQQMLQHTGLKPEEVIHVGDNPSHDIDGAHGAGLFSVWVNFPKKGTCSLATEEIGCLSELPKAVERIAAKALNRVTL